LLATLALTGLLGIAGGTPARAFSIELTFEGMKQGELVHDFYNGGFALTGNNGLGGNGSGPGPDFGVTFTNDAVILTDGKHYVGEPTPPGVMLLGDNSVPGGAGVVVMMNASAGFVSDLSFYYGSIDSPGKVQIFSGTSGTGTLLAQMDLAITTPMPAPANPVAIFTSSPVDIPFEGIAHSAVFSGGNQQIVFDNVALAIVPEPGSLTLLVTGIGMCLLVGLGCRPRAARAGHRPR
jgi:hypothetical protein